MRRAYPEPLIIIMINNTKTQNYVQQVGTGVGSNIITSCIHTVVPRSHIIQQAVVSWYARDVRLPLHMNSMHRSGDSLRPKYFMLAVWNRWYTYGYLWPSRRRTLNA